MSLLRLLGVNSSTPTSPPSSKAKGSLPAGADFKQFGLENFGNTCYINAVFQALYFCSPFRDLVIATADNSVSNEPLPLPPKPTAIPISPSPPSVKTPWTARAGLKRRDSSQVDNSDTPIGPTPPAIPVNPPSLFSALRSLFIHIAQNPQDGGKVPPNAFVKKVKDDNEAFRNNNHQDAHELLNFLLNQVVEDLEAVSKNEGDQNGTQQLVESSVTPTISSSVTKKTLVHTLFEGTLTSETRCLTCETVTSRDESFLDLSIDIEPNSSVTSCLRQFSASEMLCQRNKFSCDSCSGLQEAEKRMKVKRLPNILALHLKRFKYQEEAQKFIKLSYRVAFPLELRLFNTVDDAENPDRLYELFAIVVHIGGGPHHGHYTSIVKSRGSWFLFDDDSVESVKESDIPKYFGESNVGAGYVLFYQAVDLDYSSVGLPAPIKTPIMPLSEPSQFKNKRTQESIDTVADAESSSGRITPGASPKMPNAPLASPIMLHPKLDTSLSSSKPSHASEAPPSLTSPTREATVQKLRHSKSDRLLPRRASVTESPPPVPTLPRLIPNGDAVSPTENDNEKEEHRKSWRFGRSKTLKKKASDAPPVAVPLSPSDAQVAYSHTRARTTSAISGPIMKVDPQNTRARNHTDSEELSPRIAVQSLASSHELSPHYTPGRADPTMTSVFSSSLPPISDLGYPPGPDMAASPSLSSSQSHSNHVLTSNISLFDETKGKPFLQPTASAAQILPPDPVPKKASRKMSLSSMPLRLTGLVGRKDRET